MCDVECIEKAAMITGYGNASQNRSRRHKSGSALVINRRLHGRKAVDTIAEIYPYLLIKRKQAIIAWNHQTVRESYETKRGVFMPAEALQKQQICRDLIQRLNRREPVDIPSWMSEPASMFEPGWYLRSDVIWAKPNPMPESVTDRPKKAHEYLFLMSKRERYFYDADAIKEASIESAAGNKTRVMSGERGAPTVAAYGNCIPWEGQNATVAPSGP